MLKISRSFYTSSVSTTLNCFKDYRSTFFNPSAILNNVLRGIMWQHSASPDLPAAAHIRFQQYSIVWMEGLLNAYPQFVKDGCSVHYWESNKFRINIFFWYSVQ